MYFANSFSEKVTFYLFETGKHEDTWICSGFPFILLIKAEPQLIN
jgi:hypothetical protein